MPKSNVRFVAIWAALATFVSSGALLVAPLGIASWTEVQTGLVVATVNTLSAMVLTWVAFLWAHSVKEPAAAQGSTTIAAIAVIALGNGFGWWSLADKVGQLVVVTLLAGIVLVLTIFNRQTAYAPETVDAKVSDAKASVLRGGGGTGVPPAAEAGITLVEVLVLVVLVVLLLAVFWGFRP